MNTFLKSFGQKSILIIAVVIATPLLLLACRQGQGPKWLEDASVSTLVDVEGNSIIRASVDLKLGNTQLPTVTLPIYHPHDFELLLGQVQIIGHTGAINVDLNLDNVFGLDYGDGTLLDGSPIPMAGLNGVDVIEIPFAEGAHRIYLAFDEDVAMLGFALTIEQFDSISKTLGGVDVFYPFDFKKVKGSVGFFGNNLVSGESGLAVFIDIGQIISPREIHEAILDTPYRGPASADDANARGSKLRGIHRNTGGKLARELDFQLYKHSQKRTVFHLN